MKRNLEENENIHPKKLRCESPEETGEEAGDEGLEITHDDILLEEQQFMTTPAPIPTQKVNLFNVFALSNDQKEVGPLVVPLCRVCNSMIDEEEAMVLLSCQFCSHVGCSHCTPQCFCCGDRFCKNCSLQNYELSFERTICIDCNCSSAHGKWS
jgi:hypothetical protein